MTAAVVRDLIDGRRGGWVPRGLTGPTSDELRSLCNEAGWCFVEVRLAGVDDKPALMRTLARQLDLPPYFGGNWDAVEECLGDVVAREEGMVLRLKGLGALPEGLSEPLVDILDDLMAPPEQEARPDVPGAGGPANDPASREPAGGAPLIVVADPPLPR